MVRASTDHILRLNPFIFFYIVALCHFSGPFLGPSSSLKYEQIVELGDSNLFKEKLWILKSFSLAAAHETEADPPSLQVAVVVQKFTNLNSCTVRHFQLLVTSSFYQLLAEVAAEDIMLEVAIRPSEVASEVALDSNLHPAYSTLIHKSVDTLELNDFMVFKIAKNGEECAKTRNNGHTLLRRRTQHEVFLVLILHLGLLIFTIHLVLRLHDRLIFNIVVI